MFGQFLEDEAKGVHQFHAHTLTVALVEATWTPDTDADEVWSDISANEVDGTGNGYAQQTITGSISRSGTTITYDGTDPEFEASGGDITDARYAVIYNSSASDKLIAYCLLDTTPADVDILDTKSLIIEMNASGIGTKAPA
ncbi:MAG: hypothetical protein M5U09_22780 [Gammaproteobacteria bacterium]|nr:hypothetical protein [Gammaproteobacteria bacterium]